MTTGFEHLGLDALAECLLKDMAMLDDGSWVPDDDSIQCHVAGIEELASRNAELLKALQTLLNDCELILGGDDMSGMSDSEVFGAMADTARDAIGKATAPG